jgi:hypothetical protein
MLFTLISDVFEEYKHPDILLTTGQNLELDYFFPKLKLAVEYQVFTLSTFLIPLGSSTLQSFSEIP